MIGSFNSWMGGKYRPAKFAVGRVVYEVGRHDNFACCSSLREIAMLCAGESERRLSDLVSVDGVLSLTIGYSLALLAQ